VETGIGLRSNTFRKTKLTLWFANVRSACYKKKFPPEGGISCQFIQPLMKAGINFCKIALRKRFAEIFLKIFCWGIVDKCSRLNLVALAWGNGIAKLTVFYHTFMCCNNFFFHIAAGAWYLHM
jgi:hypothetical protein